jgi:uncharacterized membrane protein YgcG
MASASHTGVAAEPNAARTGAVASDESERSAEPAPDSSSEAKAAEIVMLYRAVSVPWASSSAYVRFAPSMASERRNGACESHASQVVGTTSKVDSTQVSSLSMVRPRYCHGSHVTPCSHRSGPGGTSSGGMTSSSRRGCVPPMGRRRCNSRPVVMVDDPTVRGGLQVNPRHAPSSCRIGRGQW